MKKLLLAVKHFVVGLAICTPLVLALWGAWAGIGWLGHQVGNRLGPLVFLSNVPGAMWFIGLGAVFVGAVLTIVAIGLLFFVWDVGQAAFTMDRECNDASRERTIP